MWGRKLCGVLKKMIEKIREILREWTGYNELLLNYNDLYNRVMVYEEVIEDREKLLIQLNKKMSDIEQKYEESKAKIAELLHKETVDILELRSWYENRRSSQPWIYNGNRLGSQDVVKYLEVDDLLPFTRLAGEIIERYNITSDNTATEVITAMYRYWNLTSSWRYITDQAQFGKPEMWETADRALATRRGDCFTGDTKIIAKDKSNNICNISFNELKDTWRDYDVLSYDLKTKKSVWKPIINFYEQGIKPVYEVKPRRGTSFKCTDTHKFLYANKNVIGKVKLQWKALSDIDINTPRTRRTCSIKGVPDTTNYEISQAMCNLIGSYVADGHNEGNRISIAGDDSDRQELLRKHLDILGLKFSQSKRKTHAYTRISLNQNEWLRSLVVDMGVKGELKKFPEIVMRANNETKRVVLFYYGQRDGTKRDGEVKIYSTISNKLQEQIKLMLTCLGIHYSYWVQTQDDRVDANRKPCHRITISDGYDVANNLDTNSIMHKEYVGEEETFDIEVADTHCFVLSDNNLVVHNCESKSKAMYWTGIEMLGLMGLDDHAWRLTFWATVVIGEGGHALLSWLGDDGEYYAIESTFDENNSKYKTWLRTPIRYTNLYGTPWGFATKDKSWRGSNSALLSFRDPEVKV